jgi:hypothetical protein
VKRHLPSRSERWAWSARAEVIAGGDAESHLVHLIDRATTLPWAAYVEGWADGQNIVVRLLVDAPDFPGAVGRAMAFLAKEWDDAGERVIGMEMHKADDNRRGEGST